MKGTTVSVFGLKWREWTPNRCGHGVFAGTTATERNVVTFGTCWQLPLNAVSTILGRDRATWTIGVEGYIRV